MKKENILLEKKAYVAPDIKVVEVVIEQNILASGSGDGPMNMPGQDW